MAAQLSFRGMETYRVSSFFGFPHHLHSLPVRFQRSFQRWAGGSHVRTYIRSMYEVIVPSSRLVERVEHAWKLWLHLVPMEPGWLWATLTENKGWDVGTQERWGAQVLLFEWLDLVVLRLEIPSFLSYPSPIFIFDWDHLTPRIMLIARDLEQSQNLHRIETLVGDHLYNKRNPLGGYDPVGMSQQHNDTRKKWATSWWLKVIFLKLQIFLTMPRCLWRFLKYKWRWKCVPKLPEFQRERIVWSCSDYR